MKYALLTLIVLSFNTGKAAANEELLRAYQREYTFLVSQKEVLAQQEKRSRELVQEKVKRVKQDIQQQQKELARWTAENDQMVEELSLLERQKRDLQRTENVLSLSQRKGVKLYKKHQAELKFAETPTGPKDGDSAVDVNVAHMSVLLDDLLATLRDSSQLTIQKAVFRDDTDTLVESSVYRLGRFAAIGETQSGLFVLAPSGDGWLKVIEQASGSMIDSLSGKLNNVYIFENLHEVAKIRKPATWVETTANLLPAAFLLAMMAVVLGLFILMAKE